MTIGTGLRDQLNQHQGAVVNILTLVALASMPSLGVYNASKAAVHRSRKICVNVYRLVHIVTAG